MALDERPTIEEELSLAHTEVRDLKQGYEAVEERARYELGMVKQDEIFFHVMDKTPVLKAPNPAGAQKPQ